MGSSITCQECGKHVPSYLNFFCHECWETMLNEDLRIKDREVDLSVAVIETIPP